MPDTPPPNACFHEVEVTRLVLREPESGRVRATLELRPPGDPDGDAPVYHSYQFPSFPVG
jgi:hypothetical protein